MHKQNRNRRKRAINRSPVYVTIYYGTERQLCATVRGKWTSQ